MDVRPVYGWNSLGQLAQVVTTRNGVTQDVYFSYDGFGRRVRKYNTTTAAVTDYVWDGEQLVEEVDVNGNTQRLYTYLPGSDNLHSVVTGGQTYYAATDAQGNVIGTVRRGDNAVTSQYAYQPFGTLELDDQNVPNALRWKGLQYDAETGLYFMRARYYAPDLGRFISQDPIGLEGGINQYAFAGNDPVNGSDPSGLMCESITAWYTETYCDSWTNSLAAWGADMLRFDLFARGGAPSLAGLYQAGTQTVRELGRQIVDVAKQIQFCGGGGFVFIGNSAKLGSVTAEAVAIGGYDTGDGLQAGVLVGAMAGKRTYGIEVATSERTDLHVSPIGLGPTSKSTFKGRERERGLIVQPLSTHSVSIGLYASEGLGGAGGYGTFSYGACSP